MQIDHVAIVVADLDAAVRLYGETLGFTEIYREIIADQGVEAVGFAAGDAVSNCCARSTKTRRSRAIAATPQTRLHHTAYRVPNLQAKLDELRSSGVRLIDERPRKGAHGNSIAFLHPKSTGGVLIELCQPRSAGKPF